MNKYIKISLTVFVVMFVMYIVFPKPVFQEGGIAGGSTFGKCLGITYVKKYPEMRGVPDGILAKSYCLGVLYDK